MKTYCVKQRKNTDSIPGSERREIAKNGRPMIKSTCAECGSTKVRFISGGTRSDMPGGFIDIHKAIGKLPKPERGWTLPGHNYTGPYNLLQKQVRYDPTTGEILEIYDPPTGPTDAVSMQHDVDYSVCANNSNPKKCKNAVDRKMVKALDEIPFSDRQWGHWAARNIINTKQKLGLGLGKKSSKKVVKGGKKN